MEDSWKLEYPLGAKVTVNYYELGSPKVMEYTSRFGDTTRVEYAPDNRHIKYTNPQGIVRAFLFDEFGRLKQIQDGTNALVTKEYSRTNRGWLELTETSETRAHTLFNADMRPVEQIIMAKTARGGQLVTKNEYSGNGSSWRQVTQGLVDEERIYENGRLVRETSGDKRSAFSYDHEGRLRGIVSDKSWHKFAYNDKGELENTTYRRGDLEEVYRFHNGQLTNRTNGKGLDDAFQYDKEGMLRSVKRSGGEHWDIQRNENRIICLRNGVVQLEYVFDEKGRLKEMLSSPSVHHTSSPLAKRLIN